MLSLDQIHAAEVECCSLSGLFGRCLGSGPDRLLRVDCRRQRGRLGHWRCQRGRWHGRFVLWLCSRFPGVDGLRSGPQLLSCLNSIFRLFLKELLDERAEAIRQILGLRLERWNWIVQMPYDHLHRVLAIKRRFSRHQVINRRAERIEISAAINLLCARGLLR